MEIKKITSNKKVTPSNALIITKKTEKKKNNTTNSNKNKKPLLEFKKTITKNTKLKTPNKNNNKPVALIKQNKPKKKRNGGKILNALLSIIMLICIAAMICVIAFGGYIVLSAPAFETDKLYSKEATIFYDKNGTEFARVGAEQRDLVYYEDLPQVLVDAIVATEDSRYFQHNGFDVVRFIKAAFGQVVGQDGAGGASTLTMQVAKNTFSRAEDGTIAASGIEGIVRKFTDIYISIFLIEKNYTKEEIMEFYVNAPFLGQQTYGVEQASQKYFGKSVRDLSLAEASLLAGIFNAPSSYNPFYSIDLAEQRRSIVLNLMVRHGYITEEQAEDAKAISIESIIVEPTSAELNKYQSFIDIVCDDIQDQFGMDPYEVPMEIYTTMDPSIQDIMVKLNNGELNYKWKTYRATDNKDIIQIGAIVTDVKDGSISAVNGGRHQATQKAFNRATDMKTQPGSTAKPIFAYGPYLEYNNGNTGTLFFDNRMTYSNGQELTNADKSYKGAMTMRQALAQSRNIPAVQAFQAVSKTKISEFVNNVGIDYCRYDSAGNPTDCNLYESYAIGGGLEVSPEDMAAAYGTFARGGYYIEPYSYTKVIFRETDETYEHKYEKVQAMSEETAYMITDMLVTATKQGVGGNIKVSGTEVASKTGTSTHSKKGVPDSASKDNWVITYSPDYVISFWYGTDYLTKKEYTTALAAAKERKLISAQLANNIYKKNSKFKKPSGIIAAKYEKETFPAQLPSDNTPSDLISTELFKKGTEPSEISDRFSQLPNPKNGSVEVSNTQINLSWNEISTPNAINTTYLQGYFSENYGQFASTYLNKRTDYNNKHIGTIGYQVYLQTDSGLQLLGFTASPYYVYNATTPGTYTFVIKSAYSIFKGNASSGVTLTADVTSGTIPSLPEIETPTIPDEEIDNENNPDNMDVLQ